jgi:all-trans-nonaprenyl-diphosphate synthase
MLSCSPSQVLLLTNTNESITSPVVATRSIGRQGVDLNRLVEPVREEIALVEDWLETNLIDDNPFITELLGQIFRAGGKRIRPCLVLLASHATLRPEEELSRTHIILAVLTELIHTASLVHDDVIDRAALRRGTETINRRFNDRMAVLMGDLLFAQASICLARIMNPVIVGIYGQVLGDLCAGEIRQMRQQFSTEVNWDHYISKSICKTASLFAAGSHSGAILNCAGNETIETLKQYGLKLGICFQIIDDLLDVTGESAALGKQPGSDMRGGLLTAPALYILERGDQKSKRLKELVETRQICTNEGSAEALQLVRENGGVESTLELAASYGEQSKEALRLVKPSSYRDSLEALVDYVLTRIN